MAQAAAVSQTAERTAAATIAHNPSPAGDLTSLSNSAAAAAAGGVMPGDVLGGPGTALKVAAAAAVS